MNDYRKIAINGFVTIKNGDIIIEGKNAITRPGMRWLLSMLSYKYLLVKRLNNDAITHLYFGSYDPFMKFGKDNSPTTQLMDALGSEIDLKQHNITNTVGVFNSNNGQVMTKYVASWQTESLNNQLDEDEKIGEIGLWLNIASSFGIGDTFIPSLNSNYTLSHAMFARFSLGDDAFVPNPNAPVIVDWEFRWEFI